MEVKKSQHKYIIGPKGNTLQEILETTGVSVEMPPLDSSSETIILRGEPDKLGPALTQVYAKVRGSDGDPPWCSVQLNEAPPSFSPAHAFIVKVCLCFRAGEERDGGGGDRSSLAAPLHHRQEGTKHRADHAAAPTGEEKSTGGCRGSTREASAGVTCTFTQVHIEFTDGEERISLEGPTEEVEQAQAQIQEIIKDLVREGLQRGSPGASRQS